MLAHSCLASVYILLYLQCGKYTVGWDVKVTSLGYKLISLNALMNGITPLQQASVWVDKTEFVYLHTVQIYTINKFVDFLFSLFPLLQLYDKHVNLSIIGYFGIVRTISLHQDQLPASPSGPRGTVEHAFSTYPEWVRTLFLIKFICCSVQVVGVYFLYYTVLCVYRLCLFMLIYVHKSTYQTVQ